ncbi:diguanylate cyclase [Actinokineospora sp. UTMC 2448]|uniref:diguanylate cyclase n=1 Tax=Actinokineospora sp. UTMC 2448 TaxID=2268449 RepID=UPI00216490CA|nr:diguanylate cyclase [Actinokineospora sp. UTMC 2448]
MRSLWVGYLVVGGLLICAYYAAPDGPAQVPVRLVTYCAVSASAALAVAWGLARHRPRPALPWILLGLSQAVYALADVIFYVAHYVLDDTSYPSLADAAYVGHYPLAVAGIVLLARRRRSGPELAGLIDALSLTAVAGLLSWVMIIGPQSRADTPALVKAASLTYPLMDLALLLVALRLVFAGGRRSGAFVLLVGWLAAILAADTLYVLQRLSGDYAAGNFLDAIWLAGNLALGASALHPSMRRLGVRSTAPPASLSWLRLAVLCAGALVAPALLLLQHARGELRDVPAYAIACAILFGLTVARLAVIAIDQRRLANTDGLTQLYTRRYFESRLDTEVERAGREGPAFAVLIVDVDHFKAINDTYGHPAGDRVLAEIAHRLRGAVRSGEVLARYGGEEFALLAQDVAAADLPSLADRLRRTVAEAEIALGPGESVKVTVSVGAVMSTGQDSGAALVAAADRALYRAKAAGRDRAAVGSCDDVPARRSTDVGSDFLYRIADLVEQRMGRVGHGAAVADWAQVLATALGLDQATVARARRAARLAHIGAIMVPNDVLLDPLTPDDHGLARMHPVAGSRLALVVPDHAEVAQVIRQLHERWDGTGWPDGLAGADIRVEARIVALCEGWASVAAGCPDAACEHLLSGRGTRFDPELVDAFLALDEDERLLGVRSRGGPGRGYPPR